MWRGGARARCLRRGAEGEGEEAAQGVRVARAEEGRDQ